MIIYHITTRLAWEKAIREEGYQPSSLSSEGFIHCSFEQQLESTGKRYFANQANLVLLWIDPDRLVAELHVESGDVPGERFPHIYGPLNLDAVERVTEFDVKNDP